MSSNSQRQNSTISAHNGVRLLKARDVNRKTPAHPGPLNEEVD